MVNMTQEAFDTLIKETAAAAAAAALEAAPKAAAHDDTDKGALWVSKKKAKYAFSGSCKIACPECGTVTKFLSFLYRAAGSLKKRGKVPAYRLSFLVPKDDSDE